jgi:hypothetical protein
MQVSTSAYYQWLKTPQDSDKDQQDQKVAENARQIFIDNKQCFGSRRLVDLLQKQGFAVGRFKMRRIMRDLNLKVRKPPFGPPVTMLLSLSSCDFLIRSSYGRYIEMASAY